MNKDAIVRQGVQTMVYTIADGKAVPVTVTVGSTSGNMIAVVGEGLSEGMPVVIRGNERIFPGSPVRKANDAGQQSPNADDTSPAVDASAAADESEGSERS